MNIFAYIWASSKDGGVPPEIFQKNISDSADRVDLIRMFEHLEEELMDAGFFYPPEKKTLMVQNIRSPYTRARLTKQEVQTMRGIIKALSRGRGRGIK